MVYTNINSHLECGGGYFVPDWVLSGIADYRDRLQSKMKKEKESRESYLPPSPHGPIGFTPIADNMWDDDLAKKIEFIPVASLSLFVFAFSIGFGPIPWLMMSELFSPEVKSLESSISTTFNWTLAFLVTKFFTTMVAAVTEAGAFWMFGGFTILTFLFCFFFVPETKGKSLDEIQQLFRSDKPYFLNIGPWRICRGEDSEDRRVIIEEEVYS